MTFILKNNFFDILSIIKIQKLLNLFEFYKSFLFLENINNNNFLFSKNILEIELENIE